MAVSKKTYLSPTIESEKVELPEAVACIIYNAEASSGYWYGTSIVTSPTYNCA